MNRFRVYTPQARHTGYTNVWVVEVDPIVHARRRLKGLTTRVNNIRTDLVKKRWKIATVHHASNIGRLNLESAIIKAAQFADELEREADLEALSHQAVG